MTWQAVFENPSRVQDLLARRAAVFESLWKDPKYLRLHARKDSLLVDWNYADAHRRPEAERLLRLAKAAMQRIQKHEDEALRKAGLTP